MTELITVLVLAAGCRLVYQMVLRVIAFFHTLAQVMSQMINNRSTTLKSTPKGDKGTCVLVHIQ